MSETIITNVSSATTTNCGVVKVGNGLSVTADGTLSAKTHGNETWISTSITLAGEGSWTATSNNTYAEIASWFDNYDRVFASLVEGSDNILKFGESSVELLKESDGRIRSMPINIEYATQLSANTDELIVMMEEEGSITIVTASKSDTPDTATIIWDGTSSNLNWKDVDTLYKSGRRLQVLSTEWGDDKFILPLVSVLNNGNNEYVFSAPYKDGRYAEVWIWHDPGIPDGSSQNEIGSSITFAKLANGAVTTEKIADGAITKAKLGSDVVISEVPETLEVIFTRSGKEWTSSKTFTEIQAAVNAGKTILGKYSNGVIFEFQGISYNESGTECAYFTNSIASQIYGMLITTFQVSASGVMNLEYTLPAATASTLGGVKVGNGLSITADGTLEASSIGGPSIFSGGTISKGTLLSSVSFDCDSFNMYLVSFKLASSTGSEISYTVNNTKLVISPTLTDVYHKISATTASSISYTFTWFQPKSASAQAALANLLPVQDECEEMEAEVTKLEQDWIDNPDETVAVDGNGVPMNISTKKTELEKKQAELEKLREDYFSKLGDWKNEVQE